MDYGKWLYQQKRKTRDAHKKSQHQHAGTLKEIRFRPETDKHDLQTKLNHAREFLEKGYKVQLTMFFKGRQVLHQDKGYEIFEQIAAELEDLAKIEQQNRMANRRIIMLLVPK